VPYAKVRQNAMFFEQLGLTLSEKQIPQVNKHRRRKLAVGAVGVGWYAANAGVLLELDTMREARSRN